MSGRDQTKACYVTGGGDVKWTIAMIMPNGKPLEQELTLDRILKLQEHLSAAARDLAAQMPEKYFQK